MEVKDDIEIQEKKVIFFLFALFQEGGRGAGIMKVDANGAKLGKSYSYITQTYFLSRN